MSDQVDTITLVCTSLNPDMALLEKMLGSAYGFDETFLHIDGHGIRHINSSGEMGDNIPISKHLSIPDAYNIIIKNLVRTNWVCCFCDDDFFYPEGLAKMIQEVRDGIVAGVAHFNFKISGHMPLQDYRGRIMNVFNKEKSYILGEKHPITPQLLKRHGRLPAGSFFRKAAWEMAGGFTGEFEHDRILWTKMAEVGVEFKYFNHLVYEFVRRENSAWHRQQK